MKKTRAFRRLLKKGTVAMPGVFDALVALLAERVGFRGIYISGAGLANGLAGYPDMGLLTMTEVVAQARYIAGAVSIPAIADADTGFGEVVNVARAVREFEGAGVAGIHIEDQVLPKRCGHLAGVRLVPPRAMAEKIAAAVEAREDRDFLIIARTDVRSVKGLGEAVARAKVYLDAGADAIFPEALRSREEFAEFARRVDAPLLANMTEFGRTPYMTVEEFEEMGYDMVIFPMTAFRIMARAVEDCFRILRQEGTQKSLLAKMQTRRELYELLGYKEYEEMDQRIARGKR